MNPKVQKIIVIILIIAMLGTLVASGISMILG